MKSSFWKRIAICSAGLLITGVLASAAELGNETAPAWQSLFDGKTLTGWKLTDFGGHGEVSVADGHLILDQGDVLTGVNCTAADLPKTNYEVALEAMRVAGSDFFCGLTFPYGETHCTLIVGGWGGGLVGVSSINGDDASENETGQGRRFENGRWYKIRLRVTPEKIQAWIDDELLVDLSTQGKKMGMRAGEIELSEPFGLATFQTKAALREIRLRRLENSK